MISSLAVLHKNRSSFESQDDPGTGGGRTRKILALISVLILDF